MARTLMPLLLVASLTPCLAAKDKVKLPAQVLHAQTILVVIDPEAGEPLTDPSANRNARDDVERALMQWGRFRLAMEPSTADLVLSVRKGSGKSTRPTISGGPIDNRPVIMGPKGDGTIRVGTQRGAPPDLTRGQTTTGEPRLGTEIGESEDTVKLYLGGDYPLDGPPIWRYSARDSLRPPKIPALDELRKAMDETEKALQKKKTP